MLGYIREGLYRLRGSKRYARFRQHQALQKLPEEELRLRQFAQVSAMLHHAYATVPYYRTCFENLKITPEDIRSFEDFKAFPVLTRQDILEHQTELLSSAVPESMRRLNYSGGTTGNPVGFYQDHTIHAVMDANWLLSISFAGWRPSDMVISIWGNPRDATYTAIPGRLKSWLAGQAILNAYRYGPEEMLGWLSFIKRYNRVFLYGYVSALTSFAEFVLQNGYKLNNIQGVITSAERLHAPQRELIGQAFNCQVYDQYGSREVPGVAMECSHGNMHLFTHSAYAEFLPLEGTEDVDALRAAEGENPQRIVLTNLSNRSMPLIRYALGDFGSSREGACPCGCTFPLMRMDIGRIGGSLRLPDGKRLYSSFFVHKMFGLPGIAAFQFRQSNLDEVQLFVVRGAGFNEESVAKLDQLQADFPKTICPGLNLKLSYVDDVPRTGAGKHRHVVCEVEA